MLTLRDDYTVAGACTRPATPAQGLPVPVTLDEHMHRAPLRCVEAKDHVFTEGDAKTHVYAVVTGAVSLYKVLADGRRQVIDFALAGDVVGLGLSRIETYNAQATTATRVRCLPVSALSFLVRHDPAIATTVCEVLSEELSSLREHLVCVVHRSALERVATFLLDISQRNGHRDRDPLNFELPMTRTDIGDFLGLTIETVSRTLTKLKTMQIIAIDQCSSVRICNLDSLRSLSTATAICDRQNSIY
jgi:CRP-like cAMP-binding protein